MLIYNENAVRNSKSAFNAKRFDPNKLYLQHYANMLQLDYFAKNLPTLQQRQTAVIEMRIAERKMNYWTRDPRFDMSACLKAIPALKNARASWKQLEIA